MHVKDNPALTRNAILPTLRAGMRYWALAAIALALFALPGTSPEAQPVAAASGGPEMTLTVTEGGYCAGNDCYAAVGSDFKLAVDFVGVPSAGYVLMETFIDYGRYDPTASEDGAGPNTCSDGIDNGDGDGDRHDSDCAAPAFTYNPTDDPADEIVWPDADVLVRGSLGPGLVDHGSITAFIPPLPLSYFEGIVVEVSMTCGLMPETAEITLLGDGPVALTYGSKFTTMEAGPVHYTPKLSSILMHCVAQPSEDTDGDGCSDVAESGPDSVQGGDRDRLSPWDFYDVAGPGGGPPDGVIDLPNDVLGVVQHFSPSGAPPYDVRYDRGPSAGPSWHGTLPPDGVIDLPNDVLGVIGQFNHSCV